MSTTQIVKMTLPKISICIPTYNRADELKDLFDSIIRAGNNDSIEVVVSDNASTDNTGDVIAAYRGRFECFTYFRWPTNQGPDRNFIKCVELASGEYCWLMGSDDAIREDAISIIKERIGNVRPGLLLASITECDADLVPVGEHRWLSADVQANDYDTGIESELLRFYENARPLWGLFLGYISSIVVSRAEWNKVEYDESYTGSFFSFTYIVMRMIYGGCLISYIDEPVVMNRGYNDSMVVEMDGSRQFKRLTLDIRWYWRFSELAPNQKIKQAYLNIGARNYTWYPLLKIRIFATHDEWQDTVKQLKAIGVREKLLWVISMLGILSPLFRLLIRVRTRFLPRSRLLPARWYS